MASEPEDDRADMTAMMASNLGPDDERSVTTEDPDFRIEEGGDESQMDERTTRYSSTRSELKLEEVEDNQNHLMSTDETKETIIGADENSKAPADGDEVVSSSSDTPRGAGLKKMDKIAAAREKRKMSKRPPDKPEGHCFRINGQPNGTWQKDFPPEGLWRIGEQPRRWMGYTCARFPGDREWRLIGKQFCEILDVDFRAMDDYADDVVVDATTAALNLEEEETPNRRAQQLRTARFNTIYRKFVYREHHTQTSKGKSCRQKRRREHTAEHENARQPKQTTDPKKETAKIMAERLGVAVALDDGDGHSHRRGAVPNRAYEKEEERQCRPPWTRDYRLGFPDRYKGGYGYWTREGRLWMLRKDIDRVIQAEKPDGTGKVLTDTILAKYIPNYDGWVKQQKLGRDVVTREGTARQGAPKGLMDQRDESTGRYAKRDPTLRKDQRRNPAMTWIKAFKHMKMRDTKARVVKDVAQNVHIQKEMFDIQEHARQALKTEEQATNDKSTLVMHAAGTELELAEIQKHVDDAYELVEIWKERAYKAKMDPAYWEWQSEA
ncbi:hypothetical protein LTS07_002393 [Exophiala sideris]|uniref:Uncharacterized protein n=1 Tax=Exophiala sideris TaxID=1016849 RepID=A0ABR0JNQ7_9EURO|nr:hypothetical protein LTS07_002393 [Exophiala sideris]KAK5067049.1 hypothetical protein LTR69_002398 [Exophiala sideris]KAK5185107.1 hypothetical protein LTR44_002954 [Eurotiomycetes sp. CCFEE 6388]